MDVPALISALGDHGFSDIGTTRQVAVLQDAIWDIESREPWPFLETSINLDFDGTSSVPSNFPTDFRAALRLSDLSLQRRIRPIRLDDFEDNAATDYTMAGDPLFYYFQGGQLNVWPVPAAATARAKLRYLKVSAAITDTSAETAILIPKRHHNAVLYGALWQLYDMTDDAELAQRYQGHFEQRIASMSADVWKQQYDQPEYVHVIDPDDWDYDFL